MTGECIAIIDQIHLLLGACSQHIGGGVLARSNNSAPGCKEKLQHLRRPGRGGAPEFGFKVLQFLFAPPSSAARESPQSALHSEAEPYVVDLMALQQRYSCTTSTTSRLTV